MRRRGRILSPGGRDIVAAVILLVLSVVLGVAFYAQPDGPLPPHNESVSDR